jgi:hypothetical protein
MNYTALHQAVQSAADLRVLSFKKAFRSLANLSSDST